MLEPLAPYIEPSSTPGKTAIFTKAITSAANAGDITVATATVAPVLIRSVTVRANDAQTADLTSIGLYAATSKVVTLITSAEGIRANIAAAGQQVCFPLGAGPVYLAAGETLVITLTGTGATAVNLQVIVEVEAVTPGGYLA